MLSLTIKAVDGISQSAGEKNVPVDRDKLLAGDHCEWNRVRRAIVFATDDVLNEAMERTESRK